MRKKSARLASYEAATLPNQRQQADPRQIQNHAGGYVFKAEDMIALRRYLILGTIGGSYYLGEQQLTRESLQIVDDLLNAGMGMEVVDMIIEVSYSGATPNNDPCLFALARCGAAADPNVRRLAYNSLHLVARTSTHLYHFMSFARQFRGRGRIHRRAIKAWYNNMPPERLIYQAIKYRQRDGWSHRDIMRLARPKPIVEIQQAAYHWIVKGWDEIGPDPHPDPALVKVWAFEHLKRRQAGTPEDLERGQEYTIKYDLPREALPTSYLKHSGIWESLLDSMPMEAMVRSLPSMTRAGLTNFMRQTIIGRLTNSAILRRSRMHPLKLLVASRIYANGKGRDKRDWEADSEILGALMQSYIKAFDTNVDPLDIRVLHAIDVSGSMSGVMLPDCGNLNLFEAAGALAYSLHKAFQLAQSALTEKHAFSEPKKHAFLGFDTSIYEYGRLSDDFNLADLMQEILRHCGGGTNCALPIQWAYQRKERFDAIIIYTDTETWAGQVHAHTLVERYRKEINPELRVIQCAMEATRYSLFPKDDKRVLELCGFDPRMTSIINAFLKGDI